MHEWSSPCLDGGGEFAGDAGFDGIFSCTANTDCVVSRCGAINRTFSLTKLYQRTSRLTSRLGCEGQCAGYLDSEAACVDGICVVPSDPTCSPGLFADAGSLLEEALDQLLPMPDAEPPPEERLFVIPEARARAEADPRADAYWTPSFEEVEQIASSRLPTALAASCDPRAKGIAPRLAAYKGQFVGVIQHGKRRILGNYLCDRWAEQDLSAHWVSVADGGECYFQFWYDPKDRSIHDISINGYG